MKEKLTSKAWRCLTSEKQRLETELRTCDFCSDNYPDHHACYRSAAKDSFLKASDCLIL